MLDRKEMKTKLKDPWRKTDIKKGWIKLCSNYLKATTLKEKAGTVNTKKNNIYDINRFWIKIYLTCKFWAAYNFLNIDENLNQT